MSKSKDLNKFNINDFAGGALAEQINREMVKILENIADPNTEWKSKRKLVVTLSFSPDEQRELSLVDIKTQSKLASPKALTTKFLIGKDLKSGRVVGAEYKKQVPGQLELELESKEDLESDGLKIIK